MATSAYHRWDRDGRPWKLAQPVKALAGRLRAHGYTVYTIGADDASHLQADAPEDHTPFSRAGWPKPHPYPYVNALDVMPPKPGQRSKVDGKALPTLQALGKQIYTDKQADHRGVAWIKYMNWEPQRDWGGSCWHDSWQPNHARRASTDRGHIHISGRTDHLTSTAADGYDPVARLRPKPTPPGDDMPTAAQIADAVVAKLLTTRLGKSTRTVAMQLQDLALAAAVRDVAARTDVVLAAVTDDDVVARLNTLADEMRQRDEAEQARDAAAATQRADILTLIRQGQDGTLDAADVVRRIGELLTGQSPGQGAT